MRFTIPALESWRAYLSKPGVYELGLIRGSAFYPKYIGKAERQNLYTRLRQYHQPSRASKIPPGLLSHVGHEARRNLVWFHVYATRDPAESERVILARHRLAKDGGLYEWNRKYE